MNYRVKDQMSPRIYPWWLILVGFVVGVFVTLVVTASRPQQSTIIYQPYNDQDILAQATQFVREATLNARTFDSGMAFPTYDPIYATVPAINLQAAGDDPIFMTATAIVIQATLQTQQQAPSP